MNHGFEQLMSRDFDIEDKKRSVDPVLAQLEQDAKIAQGLKDSVLIELTTARLAKAKAKTAEADAAEPKLVALEQSVTDAYVRQTRAHSAFEFGTLDPDEAASLHGEVIAAGAAFRHWARQLPEARSTLKFALSIIEKMPRTPEGLARTNAVEQAKGYCRSLFGARGQVQGGYVSSLSVTIDQSDAVARASVDGAAAKGTDEVWFALSEVVARELFAELSKTTRAPVGASPYWTRPTIEQLAACFEARREGLATARAKARAAVDALAAQ